MKNFSIRLDDKTRKDLHRVAVALGISEADVIRQCIKLSLEILARQFRKA